MKGLGEHLPSPRRSFGPSAAATLLLTMLCRPPIAIAEAGPNPAPPGGTPGYSDAATSHRSFADVEHWQSVFDDPARDTWQRPAQVVAALQLRPGMTVADVGAGTGYFAGHLASAVGRDGTVLAVETEPELVVHLRERAEREGTHTVVPILASFDNPRVPGGGADLLLIVNTYHHFDKRRTYLPNLRRFLKPDGRVAIIDWFKRPLPEGPQPDHKLSRTQVVEEMTAAGFALVDAPDFLPYQYFLIFRVP